MTRIAIIGAGASGLSALKYALEVFGRDDVNDELEVCVFEKQLEVGGVWYVLFRGRCVVREELMEGMMIIRRRRARYWSRMMGGYELSVTMSARCTMDYGRTSLT